MGNEDSDIIIPGDEELESYGSAAGESEPAAEDPQQQIRRERDEFKDKYLRAQAETINTSRRLQQQHAASLKLASMDLARDLLPVVDNLDRTVQSFDQLATDDTVTSGVRLIAEDLNRILKNHGIVPIEALGKPFDPSLHEALMHDHQSDAAPGTVTRELQRGYMMHDRVLRPARVAIASAEAGQSEENSN